MIEWLVPLWLPFHRATLLVSHRGAGRSWLLMRLAIAACTTRSIPETGRTCDLQHHPLVWPKVSLDTGNTRLQTLLCFDEPLGAVLRRFNRSYARTPETPRPAYQGCGLHTLGGGLMVCHLPSIGPEKLWDPHGAPTEANRMLKSMALNGCYGYPDRKGIPDLVIIDVPLFDCRDGHASLGLFIRCFQEWDEWARAHRRTVVVCEDVPTDRAWELPPSSEVASLWMLKKKEHYSVLTSESSIASNQPTTGKIFHFTADTGAFVPGAPPQYYKNLRIRQIEQGINPLKPHKGAAWQTKTDCRVP